MIDEEFAVYLPAVNTQYADAIVKPLAKSRPFPKSFSLEDLKFWQSGSCLWEHPYFLHSAGQYKIGSIPDNAVTRRGPSDGILVGDSGGYQIGTGKLAGLKGLQARMDPIEACNAWRANYDARRWILGWLETNTNWAMTIDMPLWATGKYGSESPFHLCSPDQLTELTVENLQFIDSHRRNQTKWINVIQGSDVPAIMKWWGAVKWFNCNGYAFSSSAGRASGLSALLEPLLNIRDEGFLGPGHDWIHMLGVSTAPWAIVFSAIQKAIRSTVNPNLRVSYDSASPFQDAAIRELYAIPPAFGPSTKDWRMKKKLVPQGPSRVGSNKALPFSSPIADVLTLGDLNVRPGKYQEKQFDVHSLAMIANHNAWVYLNSFQTANALVWKSNRSDVPPFYSEVVDFIGYVFSVEDWRPELKKHAKLIRKFKG